MLEGFSYLFSGDFLRALCLVIYLVTRCGGTEIAQTSAYLACLTSPSACTQLYLKASSLTGAIPTELGQLKSLKTINLISNSLTGPIPTQLELLTALTALYFQDNPRLCGTIPMTLIRTIANTSNTSIGAICHTGSHHLSSLQGEKLQA
ncbi:hypothetical protein CYMTET_16439 [Cymbomonas tetramitiformis]|uniref:Uncharacterized protein n=1 Tax=Cymbomonas tetramitiformis TaxID=36881 RepID=A0AAE0L7X6_9CHLO|nr:hypothetical protein CYMTET_16439 [Cymbomonas tetramitiformis]